MELHVNEWFVIRVELWIWSQNFRCWRRYRVHNFFDVKDEKETQRGNSAGIGMALGIPVSLFLYFFIAPKCFVRLWRLSFCRQQTFQVVNQRQCLARCERIGLHLAQLGDDRYIGRRRQFQRHLMGRSVVVAVGGAFRFQLD